MVKENYKTILVFVQFGAMKQPFRLALATSLRVP